MLTKTAELELENIRIILIITAEVIVWGLIGATIHTHLYITSTSQLIQRFRYEACVIPNVWSDIM